MGEWRVRRAAIEDARAVAALWPARRWWTFVVGGDQTAMHRYVEEATQQWEDRPIWVLERGDRVEGVLALMVFEHPLTGRLAAQVLAWYVTPAARGYGLRLWHAAREWAAWRGVEEWYSAAMVERAHRLWQRLGFKPLEMVYYRRG